MKNITTLHSFPIWLPSTQTWMHNLVNALDRVGVNNHIVCERRQNSGAFEHRQIHCQFEDQSIIERGIDRTLRRLHIRRQLAYVNKIITQTKPDILHSHFGNIGWSNSAIAKRLNIRHIVTFYGMDLSKLPLVDPRWVQRYQELFRHADLFMVEGSKMGETLERLGCPQRKIRVCHIGVDTRKFSFAPRVLQPNKKLKVLLAASFVEKKGIPYAIAALGRVKNIGIEILIIGGTNGTTESSKEAELIALELKQLPETHSVKQLGFVPHDQLLNIARECHLFLHPSVHSHNGDSEGGSPVCITEMLATGMLTVSTKHCDIPEVFGPELDWLLAEERDPSALAAIICKLLEHPGDWIKSQNIARDRIQTEYNLEIQAQRVKRIYHELLTH